jgi:predicted O-methyltransferase YrrM
MSYEFTNDWFGTTANMAHWETIFAQLKPKRCLEIGSFEGRSAVFMLEHLPDGSFLTCIDTWAGGHDLSAEAMKGVEQRFDANTALAAKNTAQLCKIKEPSHLALARMIQDDCEWFDLIYIDGSHTAPDVLTDAVMAVQLLKLNGIMIFDDYLWTMPDRGDVLNAPGIAIDTFAAIFARTMTTIAIGGQRVFQKTS